MMDDMCLWSKIAKDNKKYRFAICMVKEGILEACDDYIIADTPYHNCEYSLKDLCRIVLAKNTIDAKCDFCCF